MTLFRENTDICPEEIKIDLETGRGIVNKDALINKFLIILQLALTDYRKRKGIDCPTPAVWVNHDGIEFGRYPTL